MYMHMHTHVYIYIYVHPYISAYTEHPVFMVDVGSACLQHLFIAADVDRSGEMSFGLRFRPKGPFHIGLAGPLVDRFLGP